MIAQGAAPAAIDPSSLSAVLSAAGACVSATFTAFTIIYVRRQAVKTADQVRLAAASFSAGGRADSLSRLHDILRIFIDRPELRPYFYGKKPAPVASSLRRDRVEQVAELLADTVETAIDAGLQFPQLGRHLNDWQCYGAELLQSSPALCSLVETGIDYYPELHKFWSTAQWNTFPSRFAPTGQANVKPPA